MRLPSDSIGISDVLAWRECARRMSFGMQRHTDAGEHPEAKTVSTAYGSAWHDVAEFIEREDAFDDEAVQYAFDRHAAWLEPDDLGRLRDDLATYRKRDYLGVRTVAVEGEYRTPLLVVDGEVTHFRFRLDRVYQSLVDPGLFIHVDYKTSRWPRTEEEVHADPQMWSYNWAIHEVFPECTTLVQVYDQLRYGAITTYKSDAQRARIKEWLRRHVIAIMRDEDYADDGLLQPKLNDWCAYCPILESCGVIKQATDFTLAKLAALAPEHKEGRKIVVGLDPQRMDEYVAQLDTVAQARKALERYEESVRGLLLRMPQERRERYGYGLQERRLDYFSPQALRRAHEVLGPRFYEAAGLSKKAVERLGDEELSASLLALAEKKPSAPFVVKRKVKA